jgi:HEAT repeat protein
LPIILQLEAAKALRQIKKKAPALAVYVRILKEGNHEERITVIEELCRLLANRKANLAKLNEALKSKNDFVRMSAAEVLCRTRKQSQALSLMRDALKNKNPVVCTFACYALGRIGPDAKSFVPDLAKFLENWRGNNSIRFAAATGLGGIGPEAKAAKPALLLALEDDDYDVRKAAALALQKISAKGE